MRRMMDSGLRTRILRLWVVVFLALGTGLGVQAEPPSVKLPGRKPDSREPWSAFLGRAAHTAITRQYTAQNPTNIVFVESISLYDVVKDGKLGDPERLPGFVKQLRSDIVDTTALVLFEIKPDHEQGRQRAREQSARYLTALNLAVDPGKKLEGGTHFDGSLFLEFENGGALWQLAWRTPEPGVTLYRWSYRRKQPGLSWKERAARQEEDLPREEMEKHEQVFEQAIKNAYEGVERPTGFQGQVYRPVDCQ